MSDSTCYNAGRSQTGSRTKDESGRSDGQDDENLWCECSTKSEAGYLLKENWNGNQLEEQKIDMQEWTHFHEILKCAHGWRSIRWEATSDQTYRSSHMRNQLQLWQIIRIKKRQIKELEATGENDVYNDEKFRKLSTCHSFPQSSVNEKKKAFGITTWHQNSSGSKIQICI